jgi:FAD/FMN-containing dehydrogenase
MREEPDPLVATLRRAVGDEHVLVDPDLRAAYDVDWTRRWSAASRLVVRPGSTAEVAEVLRQCGTAGAVVVAQGGNTGLVGGGVPRGGEVVLSLRRLDAIEPVDPVGAQVVAGSGATLAAVQRAARDAGLDVGVDLAARDSATVGGMVATNAGGVRALRFGSMRAQLLGLEVVLADGQVISRLGGLAKDSSGYDLPGLFAGSEGTLGVVTKVCLRLVPLLPARVTALLGLPDTAAAMRVLAGVRHLGSVDAAELMYADGVAIVRSHAQLAPPLARECPVYLLVECAAQVDPTTELADALAACADVDDVAVATDARDRERLWAYRERHTEAISAHGVPHKLDVAVPLARLAEFADAVRALVTALDPAARCLLFGHAGDGNLHVNVLGLDPRDERVDDAVLRLVAGLGGSISAEHGIGVAKRAWLPLTRSPADIAAMRAVKNALDPAGLLNPGVLLP